MHRAMNFSPLPHSQHEKFMNFMHVVVVCICVVGRNYHVGYLEYFESLRQKDTVSLYTVCIDTSDRKTE